PLLDGQGATVTERDTVGGRGNIAQASEGVADGGSAAAGRQEDEEDVVESVEEDAEQEGSAKSKSVALNRPSAGGGSFGIASETPGVLDETVDDESSGYSADGAFGEEAGPGAPSVGDELEVPEFSLDEEASSSIEGYMSDFDDAPAENLDDDTGAVVATEAAERDAQPASRE
ncbi:unnamed protein product, partial [Laminaria digitata]